MERVKKEEEKLKRMEHARDGKPRREGICEECGNQDILVKHNGMMICESCRNSS